jgi:rhamnose transport system permease protein
MLKTLVPRLMKMQSRESLIAVFLVILLIFLNFTTVGFLRAQNILDILVNISFVLVAAVGMTMIIITGNIDVSFGSMLAVLALSAGQLAKAGLPVPVYFLIILILGGVLGGVNGILVTKFKVPSIIVTLGMIQIHRGMIVAITKGYWIHEIPQSFNYIGTGKILGIQIPILIAALVAAVGCWFMRYSRFSRKIYAVGSNRDAARLAGIDTNKVVFSVFVMAGVLVAIATMIYATRFITIQSNAGIGFEMVVITAVVVGGANIMGGSGKITGTILGALLLGVIGTALTFLKISAYWEQTFQGLLILVAVLSGVSQYYKKRKAIIV